MTTVFRNRRQMVFPAEIHPDDTRQVHSFQANQKATLSRATLWCDPGEAGAHKGTALAPHFLDQLCVRVGAMEVDEASQEPVDGLLLAVKPRYILEGLLEGRFSAWPQLRPPFKGR